MNITHEHMNKLLKRREVTIKLDQTSPPTHAHVLETVAAHFKAAQEHVAIKSIGSHYGAHHFTVNAFVYDSEEAKKHTEPRIKEKKAAA